MTSHRTAKRCLGAVSVAGKPNPLILGITLALFSTLAAAADEDKADAAPAKAEGDSSLATVTVTAERRATDVQKTAVAVSAIGESQLQERGVHTLADLAGQAAGLTLPSPYLNQQYVFIRGIGNSRPAGNPSVGVYIDDVYIARQFGNAFANLPDIERIEVLRGPQGSLYGQNTSSGAIKIISRDPSDAFHGSLDVAGGNLGTVETKAYVSGALVPNILSASLAVAHRRNDGYFHNDTLDKDVNRFDTSQARAKLLFKPNDQLRFDLAVDEADDNSDNAVGTPINRGLSDRHTLAGWDTRTDQKNGGISLRASDELDDHLTLKSITAWRRIKDDQPWDSDGLPISEGIFKFQQYINQRQFSQEFQLLGDYGNFDFVTGATAFREHFNFDRVTSTKAGSNWQVTRSWNEKESYGVFGQLHYKVTDAFGITGGLRYSREQHTLDADAYASDAHRDLLARQFSVEGIEQRNHAVTPKLTLDYTFQPGLFTYFTIAKGETSGGWNPAPAGSLALATVPIDPEEVISYEWGVKSTAFDNRVQNNIALFYNDYRNYQTNLTNPTINNNVVLGSVLTNVDKAHTYGAELETSIRFTPALQTNFSVSYLRTKFDQFLKSGTTAADYTGNELPFAPHLTLNANAVYDIRVPGGDLRLNGTAKYSSKYYSGPENTYATPAQTLVDLGGFYTPSGSQLTFSLTVKNLFDRTYETPSVYSYSYNTQRQWLAGVRYDF
ncbi:TonB-dependent receptor [Pseudomonas typographi]|uniref:TonB-dependent receptor n=1 Tax=Pseudomonas typographi TaxID=2715964 RepID=UPI001682ACAA|nr:TonB-dependent receptor [Pseudomonas typographi]MBD1551927.1 TonB-dependent receptor [Pseudomonas typographi]